MSTVDTSSKLYVPCRRCGSDTYHHQVGECVKRDQVVDQGTQIDFAETYSLLQCQVCGQARMRLVLWNSENEESSPQYFPPSHRRRPPDWVGQLDERYAAPLNEVYAAYDAGFTAIATMGARAVLDVWVSSQSSNRNNFAAKLQCLRDLGTLSARQIDLLAPSFDAGSGAAHRGYVPDLEDSLTVIEAVENVLHQELLLPRIERVKRNTPPRK